MIDLMARHDSGWSMCTNICVYIIFICIITMYRVNLEASQLSHRFTKLEENQAHEKRTNQLDCS